MALKPCVILEWTGLEVREDGSRSYYPAYYPGVTDENGTSRKITLPSHQGDWKPFSGYIDESTAMDDAIEWLKSR